MKKEVIVCLKNADVLPETEADFIGADAGALTLAKRQIRMKAAIGDFDSVQEDDIAEISRWSEEVIRLNPIKDDSDSEHAVKYAKDQNYKKIYLCGAFGGRADHEIVNLRLAMQNPGLVVLYDRTNRAYACTEGTYTIPKSSLHYLSFFTETSAVISLEGFRYPLHKREITYRDLYTVSNEIIGDTGVLTVHQGVVLCLETGD